MSEYKNIGLLPNTKEKLEKYKKVVGTYDRAISDFINYFDSTGIKPSDTLLNPSSIIKNSSERVIKILKNIENKKIDRVLKMNEYIISKLDTINSPNQPQLSTEKSPVLVTKNDSGLSVDQVQELTQQLVEFKTEISHKNQEISNLNMRLVESNNSIKDNQNDSSNAIFEEVHNSIKELIEIVDKAKPSGFSSNEVKVDKHMFMRTLKGSLNIINNR